MAKSIGPLLLLGGAAALAVAASRKKSSGSGGGEILASGNRSNSMNIPMYYQVKTQAGIPGFAAGEGNIAYVPQVARAVDYTKGIWTSLDPQATVDDAVAVALSYLEEQGFTQEL